MLYFLNLKMIVKDIRVIDQYQSDILMVEAFLLVLFAKVLQLNKSLLLQTDILLQ